MKMFLYQSKNASLCLAHKPIELAHHKTLHNQKYVVMVIRSICQIQSFFGIKLHWLGQNDPH